MNKPDLPLPSPDEGAGALLDELASIEAELDPAPVRRGQLIADVLVVAVVFLLTVVLGWELTYPLALVALLVVARGVARLVERAGRSRLSAAREKLMSGIDPGP